MHLLNFVWPNVFEQSPHVINAVFEALNGMMVGLGPTRVFHYVLQVRVFVREKKGQAGALDGWIVSPLSPPLSPSVLGRGT